jgi:hypothetical protein
VRAEAPIAWREFCFTDFTGGPLACTASLPWLHAFREAPCSLIRLSLFL